MIARIVTCTVTPSKVSEFRTLLNNTLLPKVQSQHGFVENIEALDPNSGQFSSDNGVFPEIAAKMSPLLNGNPVVQTLPVENSSEHNVRTAAATSSR